MAVTVKSYERADSLGKTIAFTFDEQVGLSLANGILDKIVVMVAERYVQENYPALVSKLDQQAIANLVIAESGRKIAEEIRLTPIATRDKETKTEVYQRGILGGMRRVR